MTKVLILVISCVKHELNGFNQAMRDTWLPEANNLGLSHRFVIGNGTPTGEDETALFNSYRDRGDVFKTKRLQDPDIRLMESKEDQLIVNTPDDFLHVTYKFREACRWAVSQNYEYIFQALTDTFVVPSRLVSSGFEEHDYIGSANNERTAIGGGAGMWLSRKALQYLVNAPVDMWVHDGWVGKVMLDKDVVL